MGGDQQLNSAIESLPFKVFYYRWAVILITAIDEDISVVWQLDIDTVGLADI